MGTRCEKDMLKQQFERGRQFEESHPCEYSNDYHERPTRERATQARRTPKGRQVDPRALAEVQALLGDRSRQRDLLIEHLHLIQDRYGYLSAAHLAALAEEMKLALAEVYEVATFYAHFDVVKEGPPPPPVTVRVCENLSCAMAGAEKLLTDLPGKLGSGVRVLRAPCMGACDRAPVCAVGHVQVIAATPDKVRDGGQSRHARAPLAWREGFRCLSGRRRLPIVAGVPRPAAARATTSSRP